MALPPPSNRVISPPCVLLEFDQNHDDNNIGFRLDFPSFPYGGSMELMVVPKKKVPSDSSVIIITSVFFVLSSSLQSLLFSLSLFVFFFFLNEHLRV
jgi:hypothetical protein